MGVEITHHAFLRGKERLNLNNRAVERLAGRAYEQGLCHKDLRGNLKKYIDGIYLSKRNANNIRIYGDGIYLFSNNILITIMKMPHNLKKLASANKNKK